MGADRAGAAQWMHRLGYTRTGPRAADPGSLDLARPGPDRPRSGRRRPRQRRAWASPATRPRTRISPRPAARLRLLTPIPERPLPDTGHSVHRPQTLALRPARLPGRHWPGSSRSSRNGPPQAAELPEDAIDRDQLLTNVTLYWLTGKPVPLPACTRRTAHAALAPGPPRASRPGWRSSPNVAIRRSPTRTTTSCTGRSSTAAATSPPWRPRLPGHRHPHLLRPLR